VPGTGRLPITHQLHICEFASVSVPQPSNADGWPQVWRDENGYEFAQGYTISGVNYLSFPGIVVFTFSDNDERVVAIPESRTLSVLIEDLFWRSALPLILQMQGYGALHASAVMTSSGVVGFCAAAGKGKSTLAYGLSLRGYPVWTDDALVFDAIQEPVLTAALPFKVRMRTGPAEYYRTSRLSKQDHSLWQRDFQRAPLKTAPVRAVIVLKRNLDESKAVSIGEIKGTQALSELLEQAYAFSLRNIEQRRSISEQYINLTARVPTYALNFPTGLQKLPAILEHLDRFLQKERQVW
jgi:hypothetical protein